jgi:hypothetical protein
VREPAVAVQPPQPHPSASPTPPASPAGEQLRRESPAPAAARLQPCPGGEHKQQACSVAITVIRSRQRSGAVVTVLFPAPLDIGAAPVDAYKLRSDGGTSQQMWQKQPTMRMEQESKDNSGPPLAGHVLGVVDTTARPHYMALRCTLQLGNNSNGHNMYFAHDL